MPDYIRQGDNSHLDYTTPGDNQRHAYRTGLRKTPVTRQMAEELAALKGTVSYRKLAERFGIAISTAFRVSHYTKEQREVQLPPAEQ